MPTMQIHSWRCFACLVLYSLVIAIWGPCLVAQDRHAGPAPSELLERQLGPFNVHVLAGGGGVTKPLPEASKYLLPGTPYTFSLWVEMTSHTPPSSLLAGLGDPNDEASRFLGL